MTVLWFDCETYSECDLFSAGTHAYAEHPSTEITVVQWAIDDGEPLVLDCTLPNQPIGLATLEDLLRDPSTIVIAHNSHFDRTLLRHVWGIGVPVERWRDTMVKALAHGLPGALGKIGAVLGLAEDEAKDKRGRELVNLFCKPRPKNHKLRRATRETHPKEWAEFLEYSRQDVVAMRAIDKRLPNWNYRDGHPELALWHLDQRINDRGLAIDLDLARAAIGAVAEEQQRLKAETAAATDGAVRSPSQRDELLSYILLEHGVRLPDMSADTLRRRAEDPNLPDAVKLLINLRLEATKASTAKYKAAINATSGDGRLRNALQFCGAARTGRWAGRLMQLQNLPRPSRGFGEEEQALGIASIKAGAASMLYDNVMQLAADCIRGLIVAPPGRKLCIADLSNIEGRVLAFLAGEEWKLQAFREFDAGRGADIYKLAYARSFGVDASKVDKDQRQIGKVQELMLGYEGGVGAYLTGAATYGFDIADLAASVQAATDGATWRETLKSFDWFKAKGLTYGLPVEHWAACRVLVDAWREAHPHTRALWSALKDAYIRAVAHRGETVAVGKHLKVRADGAWLRIRLPSGRYLCYLSPEVDADGGCSYMGVDQYTRQWKRIRTHGGKLAENCLAGDALVLTEYGWMRIGSVPLSARVWDGVEWVRHDGLTYSGKQATISIDGVGMTPDHRILTTEGWRQASSCEGLERVHCRLPDARAGGQQRGLQRQQLHVGDVQAAGEQHPTIAPRGHASGADDRDAGVGSLRGGVQHAPLSVGPRVANRSGVEPVYDLLNCGPRNRFVVCSNHGIPFIVHNCTQAVARDVLFASMPSIEAEGYEIVLSVHDELLTETPDTEAYNHERLAALMSAVPDWAPGLPLAAAGFETTRYRKD